MSRFQCKSCAYCMCKSGNLSSKHYYCAVKGAYINGKDHVCDYWKLKGSVLPKPKKRKLEIVEEKAK